MEWRRRSFICHHDWCMDYWCLDILWCTAIVLMHPVMVCMEIDGFSGMENIVLSLVIVGVENRMGISSIDINSMANALKSLIKL